MRLLVQAITQAAGDAGGDVQQQQLITFKVGQMQHAWLVHPVVLASLKEGVKQVGEVCDGTLSLGRAQQHVVPLT